MNMKHHVFFKVNIRYISQLMSQLMSQLKFPVFTGSTWSFDELCDSEDSRLPVCSESRVAML